MIYPTIGSMMKKDELFRIAEHFFELGLKAKEE